jgi:hypothetical protein
MKVSRFAFGGKNDVDKWRAHLSGAGVPRRNHCQMCSPDEHILGVQGLPPYFSARRCVHARPQHPDSICLPLSETIPPLAAALDSRDDTVISPAFFSQSATTATLLTLVFNLFLLEPCALRITTDLNAD